MAEIYDRLRAVESKQFAHESVCSERYAGIMQHTTELKEDFKSMNNRLIGVAILLISGLASILIKLLLK